MAKRKARRSSRRSALGMATTKDFVAVAGILKRNGASCKLVGDFASHFRGDNPRFDRGRFEKASGCG